jgi:tripartite ATP-independent transporter DctP family solute receptor
MNQKAKMAFRTFLLATGIGLVCAAAQAQTVLRIGTGQAAADPTNITLQEVCDRIKARTDGKLVLQLFPAGQLGAERDMQEQVKMGAPLITVIDSGYFTNYSSKDVGILSAPFAVKNYAEVKRILASDVAKEWLERAEKNNIKLLSFNWFFGERHIFGKKPYVHVADLKNVKFRLAPIGIYIDSFKALGVSPVTLDFSEVYGALQQGVTDAAEGSLTSIYSAKLYEVAPYITRTGHVKQALGIMMNKKMFDALPEEFRKVLTEEMTRGGDDFSVRIANRQEELRVLMEKAGAKFADADIAEYSKTILPIYDSYKEWSPGLMQKIQAIAAGR